MSTLDEQITAQLDGLAAGGVWYGFNEAQNPTYPFITWQRTPSSANVTLSGPSDMQNTRIQIDVFSRRVSELRQIVIAINTRFAAWSVQNLPISSQDIPEPEIRAFRASLDWSIWSNTD